MKVYGFTYNCEKCAIDSDGLTSFIYAHGELDDKCGYDLVYIPGYRSAYDMEDGDYDVTFIYPDSTEVSAKLFVWTDKYGHHRGLCVDKTDLHYLKDAQKKYETKAESC